MQYALSWEGCGVHTGVSVKKAMQVCVQFLEWLVKWRTKQSCSRSPREAGQPDPIPPRSSRSTAIICMIVRVFSLYRIHSNFLTTWQIPASPLRINSICSLLRPSLLTFVPSLCQLQGLQTDFLRPATPAYL